MPHLVLPPQAEIDEFVGAAHGDLQRVRTFLDNYPDLIYARASWDESAIEAATQTGRVEIAELLLSKGASLDICTAAMLGRKQNVEAFLIDEPSLVLATGAHGIPLLYFPVIRGNYEIAEFLREHGADVNAGTGANTPLHGAVTFDQPEMVNWLLKNGADCHAIDYNGKTPLALAEENNQVEIAALLRNYGCEQ